MYLLHALYAGNPCAMLAKLTHHANPKNYAVDWDGIRDLVLDMATYCCSAMATVKYVRFCPIVQYSTVQ